MSLDETLDVGEDTGTAVDPAYEAKMPFKFTGKMQGDDRTEVTKL